MFFQPEILNKEKIAKVQDYLNFLGNKIIFMTIMKIIVVAGIFEATFVLSAAFITGSVFHSGFLGLLINLSIALTASIAVNYLYGLYIRRFEKKARFIEDYLIPIDLDDESSELTKKAFDFFAKYSDLDWVFKEIGKQNRTLLKGELNSCISYEEGVLTYRKILKSEINIMNMTKKNRVKAVIDSVVGGIHLF